MRVLPTFKGYTIDYRLKELRRVVPGEELTIIPFRSEEGRQLICKAWEDQRLVIRCESDDSDAWVCACGNRPTEQGFFPCDWSGERLEPGLESWPDALYICDRCGRIIDADRLAVVSLPVETEEPVAV